MRKPLGFILYHRMVRPVRLWVAAIISVIGLGAFTILGIWEADPDHGVLSYLAPLGGAFLNARPGQAVDVTTNDGTRHHYEI